jgi:hypothetical protein
MRIVRTGDGRAGGRVRTRLVMERWLNIDDVEAVRETPTELLCRIDGREVPVPFEVIRPDSQVWRWGDRGVLTLPFWFATGAGLA